MVGLLNIVPCNYCIYSFGRFDQILPANILTILVWSLPFLSPFN